MEAVQSELSVSPNGLKMFSLFVLTAIVQMSL